MSKNTEKLMQQLDDIRTKREAVIQASTKRQLELLDEEERSVRQMLESMERVESQLRHSIPPTAEETKLWEEIRDLMGREAAILHEKMIPEKYIRADAVEHFEADLQKRIDEFENGSAGLKFHQSHGPRVIAKRQQLQAEKQSFERKIRPLCLDGQKLFSIRDRIKTLSAQRDALKDVREAKALASVK